MRLADGGTGGRIRGDPRSRVVRSFGRASGAVHKRTFHGTRRADALSNRLGSRRMPRARQIVRLAFEATANR